MNPEITPRVTDPPRSYTSVTRPVRQCLTAANENNSRAGCRHTKWVCSRCPELSLTWRTLQTQERPRVVTTSRYSPEYQRNLVTSVTQSIQLTCTSSYAKCMAFELQSDGGDSVPGAK